MSVSAPDLLRHILDEIRFLLKSSVGLTIDDFLKDEILQRAFVRSLEIIGEATKKLPADFREKYPGIDWRGMAGTRDKLIHDYFEVDLEIVWDILKNKLPQLEKDLQAIIS